MACTTERSRQIGDLVAGQLGSGSTTVARKPSGITGVTEILDHLAHCAPCSEEFDLACGLVAAAERTKNTGEPLFEPAERALDWRIPVSIAAALLVSLGLWVYWSDPATTGGPSSGNWTELASVAPLPAVEGVLRADSTDSRGEDWASAMQHYAAADHAEVVELLVPLAENRPTDALVSLYLGISLLELGETRSAGLTLENAARHGEGLLVERALWYLAHAHLALEEPDAAVEVLQRLTALEGDYELDATDLLKEIQRLAGE
jgi:hypothetical protein